MSSARCSASVNVKLFRFDSNDLFVAQGAWADAGLGSVHECFAAGVAGVGVGDDGDTGAGSARKWARRTKPPSKIPSKTAALLMASIFHGGW